MHLLTYDFEDKVEIISIKDKNDSLIYYSKIIFEAEKIIGDVINRKDIDRLIIPGGNYKKHDPIIYELIGKLNFNNKIIGVICGSLIYWQKLVY